MPFRPSWAVLFNLLFGVVDVLEGMDEEVLHVFDVLGKQAHRWFLPWRWQMQAVVISLPMRATILRGQFQQGMYDLSERRLGSADGMVRVTGGGGLGSANHRGGAGV